MPVRILVVDDEPDLEIMIRQRFRRRIRDRELEFSFAGDGLDALEQLQRDGQVDIVLTDIKMPRMDGLTLLNRVRDLDRILKVIIVSAYGDMRNIRTAMNRGAFDFITKPIDLEDLEITIDKTQRELDVVRHAIAHQKQLSAIQRELEIANQIQLSALPCKFPAYPERSDFDLYATMIPANEVGGDFYDFFLIDEHQLGFVLGEVSGKGVGAAMFMAVTRTMFRATALQGMRVDECVRHVNRVLQPESMPPMFVTLVYGVLDTRSGHVRYVNAGHKPPFIIHSRGDVSVLESTGGIGLCLKKEFDYSAKCVYLAPNDSILLYTDGVTEAESRDRGQFSAERLRSCLEQRGSAPPSDMIRGVFRALDQFSGGAVQSDDLTLLALQYLGPQPE